MRKFVVNGFKLISRLDRDAGVLIDNCLGFLYSIHLESDMRMELGQIEGALYDMVYLGRTPAGCEFKETLFRTRILPLMKRLAPVNYYFGIHPKNSRLVGYWKQSHADVDYGVHESLSAVDDRQPVSIGSHAAG
ncbi:MAG: hypothetical protein WBY88_17900 [Desulfosarcina sp.]